MIAADRDAFAHALAAGRGEAILWVQQHGASELQDLILHACLHQLAYDPQCEGSRAGWLFELVRAARLVDQACAVIDAALRAPDDPDSELDDVQILELALLLARSGAALDHELLTTRLCVTWGEYGCSVQGTPEWIAFAGEAVLLRLARAVAARGTLEADAWMLDGLFGGTEAAWAHATAVLQPVGRREPALRHLLQTGRRRRERLHEEARPTRQRRWLQRRRHQGKRRSWRMLQQPLALQDQGGYQRRATLRNITFGARHFAAWQFKAIWQRLLTCTDVLEATALLHGLAAARLPDLPPQALQALHHPDLTVRRLWASALAGLKHPQLRAQALEWLAPQHTDTDAKLALDLLCANYDEADAAAIEALLARHAGDEEALHHLAGACFDLWRWNPQAATPALLDRLYGVQCSICRRDSVARMIASGTLSDERRRACLLDVNEDTRALAAGG